MPKGIGYGKRKRPGDKKKTQPSPKSKYADVPAASLSLSELYRDVGDNPLTVTRKGRRRPGK